MDRKEKLWIVGRVEDKAPGKEIEFPLIHGRGLIRLSIALGLIASAFLWLQTVLSPETRSMVLLLAISASVFTAGTLLGTRSSRGSFVQIPGLVLAMAYLALSQDFELFDRSYLLVIQALLWGSLAAIFGIMAASSGAYGHKVSNQ